MEKRTADPSAALLMVNRGLGYESLQLPGKPAREDSFISHISPKAGEIWGTRICGTVHFPQASRLLGDAAKPADDFAVGKFKMIKSVRRQ